MKKKTNNNNLDNLSFGKDEIIEEFMVDQEYDAYDLEELTKGLDGLTDGEEYD